MADLRDLRSGHDLRGDISATQLDTESCFLNDSWSYPSMGVAENDRKHDDLDVGAMGFMTP